MNIGEPRRELEVEPVLTPVPEALPVPEPASPAGAPASPAPSGAPG
jgi:hypothetical protein